MGESTEKQAQATAKESRSLSVLSESTSEDQDVSGGSGNIGNDSSRSDSGRSTASSTSMQTLSYGRYDETQQTLRLEYITDAAARRALLALKLPAAAAVVAFIVLLVLKCTSAAGRYFVLNRQYHIVNVVIASVLLAFLAWFYFSWWIRFVTCLRTGKKWSHRRWQACRGNAMRGGAMVAVLVLYLAANAALLHRPSIWCSGTLVTWLAFWTWTLWNFLFAALMYDAHCVVLVRSGGKRKDATARDMPLLSSYHWWKLLMFVIVEGSLVWTVVNAIDSEVVDIRFVDAGDRVCAWGTRLHCNTNRQIIASSTLTIVGFLLYWAFALGFVITAWRQIHRRAYLDYKIQHTILRLQIRILISFTIVIISAVLLWLVGPDSCANFALSWFGMIPLVIVMTGVQWLGLYLTLPRHPSSPPPKMNELYQAFAWTEASKYPQIEKRNRAFMEADAHNEPMFCMETAIKLFYFSALIYDFTEADGHAFSTLPEPIRELLGEVEQAMSFYKLVQRRLFYDRTLETKILSAWSDRTIVISIRGSSATANFVADAQMLRVVHPPRRKYRGSTPLVHQGFQKTFSAGGINELLVEHVQELLESAEDRSIVQILVTGHSLGGAVAILAAYDIRTKCQLRSDQVTCYTFGCPRVGNRAFAAEYVETVPDTWSIINDQDLVTRGMKLYGLYKRAGHRVIINSAGDLIVRPSLFELSLMQSPFRSSVGHHATTAYQQALHDVLRTQMDKGKRQREGLAGVLELLKTAPIVREGLDNIASQYGTNLTDQLRSISMLTKSLRLNTLVGGSSSRGNSSLEEALAAVPAQRGADGEEYYAPVYDGTLEDAPPNDGGATITDSVVVDVAPSEAPSGRAGLWRKAVAGVQAAGLARAPAVKTIDGGAAVDAVPGTGPARRPTVIAPLADADAARTRRSWRQALHGVHAARAAPAAAAAQPGGAPPKAGDAQDVCRVRKCYIIPEDDGGESCDQQTGAVNGGLGRTEGSRPCKWVCPLSASINELPSNATVSANGNIISIGAKPNMRACRLSKQWSDVLHQAGRQAGGVTPPRPVTTPENGVVLAPP